MSYIVEIKGLETLRKKLSPTQFTITKKQGMTNAVVFMEGKVKENTPFKKGELRASWLPSVSEDGMEGRVTSRKEKASYGPYVEYGTGVYIGRGRIYPKKKKALAWDGMVRRSVAGQRGQFFVKRTWEAEGGVKLIRFFANEINKQLES